MQKVSIIIQPRGGKVESLKRPIALHRYPAAELNRNMRAGLWFPFLSLLGSCWCAPQQTCHHGDELLGKSRFSFKKNNFAFCRTSEPPVRCADALGVKAVVFFGTWRM